MKKHLVSLLAAARLASAAALPDETITSSDSNISKRAASASFGLGGLDTYASGNPFVTLDGGYRVNFQNTDGNLVVYDGGCAAWYTGATHAPNCDNNACQLVFQSDGNLVAYAGTTAFWNSHTAGAGHTLVFRNSQPFVAIYNSANGLIWSTGSTDHCGGSGGGGGGGDYYYYDDGGDGDGDGDD